MDRNERAILWAAIEDYAGLWELPWELVTTAPDAPLAGRLPLAREILKVLLARDCVALYRGTDFDGEQTAIPAGETGRILAMDENWLEPRPKAVQVRVAATAAGRRAYEAEPGP